MSPAAAAGTGVSAAAAAAAAAAVVAAADRWWWWWSRGGDSNGRWLQKSAASAGQQRAPLAAISGALRWRRSATQVDAAGNGGVDDDQLRRVGDSNWPLAAAGRERITHRSKPTVIVWPKRR